MDYFGRMLAFFGATNFCERHKNQTSLRWLTFEHQYWEAIDTDLGRKLNVLPNALFTIDWVLVVNLFLRLNFLFDGIFKLG
jgi:hypothetical protein